MPERRKGKRGLQTLAQGSLALAKTHANEDVIENIEAQLEKELERDEAAAKSDKPLARVRHKGEKFLHSKHILLIIVALNVIDCVLVLGELILDVHYIVDLLNEADGQSEQFMDSMQRKHHDIPPFHDIAGLYGEIIRSEISWKTSETYGDSEVSFGIRHKRDESRQQTQFKGRTDEYMTTEGKEGQNNSKGNLSLSIKEQNVSISNYKKRHDIHSDHHGNDTYSDGPGNWEVHVLHGHSVEEDIAHGLHKASITILAILVVETAIKIFCEGLKIFERKVEVFDCGIVVVSFVLDLVFIKGLTMYPIQKYVFILAFLVPWRVIRVVNSLIVAVMDHEHFRLKLLYHQKKRIGQNLKTAKHDIKVLQARVERFQKLCVDSGIPEWKINQHSAVSTDNSSKGSARSVVSLALFHKPATKRHSSTSDGKPDMNGRVHRSSSGNEDTEQTSETTTPTNDPDTMSFNVIESDVCNGHVHSSRHSSDNSGPVLFNIEEVNEHTGLMTDDEDDTNDDNDAAIP